MIVIDTSVAGKWLFKSEQGVLEAEVLLANHISGEEKIVVPDLFFYEIANTLATKGFLSSWKITYSLTKIYKVSLMVYYPKDSDVKNAAKLAKKYNTSAYDMLYAVVAKYHKATLVTADEKFVKQIRLKFVKSLID